MNRFLGKLLALLVQLYQLIISPILPNSCRFYPSCSEYSREALMKYGFWRGSRMMVSRIWRCNPLHPGGYDPVE
jgi:hypothetical protein